jgi:hypothetical protein
MGFGPVIEVFVTQPRPGRLLDAVRFGDEIAPMVLREGARSVRLYLMGPAGSETGRHAFVIEHADFASFGRMHDAGASPEWMDVMQRATAPDSAFDMLQHSVLSEVLLH